MWKAGLCAGVATAVHTVYGCVHAYLSDCDRVRTGFSRNYGRTNYWGNARAMRLPGPKKLDGTELPIEHCACTWPLGWTMLN